MVGIQFLVLVGVLDNPQKSFRFVQVVLKTRDSLKPPSASQLTYLMALQNRSISGN